MKKCLVAFIFIAIGLAGRTQSLAGVWQQGTPEVSAGYHNVYEFNSNGSFKYRVSEYFGLKRILSINGTYKVQNNKVLLTVTATTEVVGGTPEKSEISGEASGGWQITGGQIKTIPLPKPVTETITVTPQKSDKADAQLILIDGQKYYRVD